MTQEKQMTNPLGTDRISTLVARFAVPSIIAMLVSAVYNIADQLFIGNAVGTLGNAATNIAFPLSMLCTSLALLFGIGGAASFNLHMGAGRKEEAPYYIGNSITMLLSLGFLLLLITELFLNPAVSALWFPGRCTPTGRAICPRHSGRFSISDLNHRKRSPDPCGRQPENGNVCHSFRCCH